MLKESAYILEWGLRWQILTLSYKAIFSFPQVTEAGLVPMCTAVHHTEVPAWGLVGLTSAWALSPGTRMHPPGQKAPHYNLHRGSMCAGRSRPHFGVMSSPYSECCVVYCPIDPFPFPSCDFFFFWVDSVNRGFHGNGNGFGRSFSYTFLSRCLGL